MPSGSPLSGRWALVTGASAGIGVALARELARRGVHLVLTARRQSRLEALAAELEPAGVQVRTISADLNDAAAPQHIFDTVSAWGIAIDVLIDNAGLGLFGPFHTNSAEQELSQVRVNCEAVVRLARLFVPPMVERRRGWVLITASTASFQPLPYLATYAATKAFDRFFALGLAEEVGRYGVHVTALCPGPTESEFFDIAGAGILRKRGVQSAEAVARAGILALERGKRTVLPHWTGRMTAGVVRFLPVGLVTGLVERFARRGLPQ
ncbi:MAG: SDR family NAD(P)-dependent oxidoreductase [Acidobacteriota bacterium]